jgi:hypothetical protein
MQSREVRSTAEAAYVSNPKTTGIGKLSLGTFLALKRLNK